MIARSNRPPAALGLVLCCTVGAAAAAPPAALESELIELIEAASLAQGQSGDIADFILPDPADPDYLDAIPQDPSNPLTPEKIALGRLLFHETAVGTATPAEDRRGTYGCASCHHVAAGFKSGLPQGIADGGSGFGERGEGRRLAAGVPPEAADHQPVATPTAMNAAYPGVMLWNGALGGRPDGVNGGVANGPDFGPSGAKVNQFGLSGLETQVLAGTRVHRLSFDADSIVHTHPDYQALYEAAFPGGDTGYDEIAPDDTVVTPEALGAALAIAAYERTLLASEAPFQRWLRGERDAMGRRELEGARLFFGKGGCVDCHTGPALSSWPEASAEQLFFAVGFADLDTDDRRVHGTVPDADARGRGGFTDDPNDDYKFRIPSLSNLRNARVLGHGASFGSVREVIEYKNAGMPENGLDADDGFVPDFRFVPLGLDRGEVRDLIAFVERALHDPALSRYVPESLPSGHCFPVADFQAVLELGCL